MTVYDPQFHLLYNNPSTPNIYEAVTTFRNASDLDRFWAEILASPAMSRFFACDYQRRFARDIEPELLWPSDRSVETPEPSSLRGMLTILSDPDGMVSAENLAIELCRRLLPWSATWNREVVWSFTDNSYEPNFYGPSFESAWTNLACSLEDTGFDLFDFIPTEESIRCPFVVRWTMAGWSGWNLAAEQRIPRSDEQHIGVSNWSFHHKENPFEPLLHLWATGYRCISKFAIEDPVIRLYAKPVALPVVQDNRFQQQ